MFEIILFEVILVGFVLSFIIYTFGLLIAMCLTLYEYFTGNKIIVDDLSNKSWDPYGQER